MLATRIEPPPGKSFLSNVEKAKRSIGPVTVGKLIKALDLPDFWIDRFLDSDVSPDSEVTQADRDTDRLLRLVAQDVTAPQTAEDLLLSLAADFAGGRHVDPMTAYTDLQAALQEAANLKALGMLPQNTSDQVTLVLQRVATLNDQGLRDDAAAEVDRAIADLDASHDAQKSALVEIGIRQDRIRNNPEAAAKRLLSQLRSVAHPGGLFRAIRDTCREWFERGRDQGIGFDLGVALHLARANEARSKGPQHLQSLSDLGLSQFTLGRLEGRNDLLKHSIANFHTILATANVRAEPSFWARTFINLIISLVELGQRETSTARLDEAIKTAVTALTRVNRKQYPLDWAGIQLNLGSAHSTLGQREGDSVRLEEAVHCIQAALEEFTRASTPQDWARGQNMLGTALQALGDCDTGTAQYEASVAAFGAAVQEQPRNTVPLEWAVRQNNLGNALWRWGARESGTARIIEAIDAYRLALEERTRDRMPLHWAMTWGNMGEAMTLLADRTDDLAMARQALTQLEEAEVVLRDAGHEVFARYSADRIPRAQAVIARLS